jgi:hypothetical protein
MSWNCSFDLSGIKSTIHVLMNTFEDGVQKIVLNKWGRR